MVNEWLNSLDDELGAPPARYQGRSEGRADGRVERRPEASAFGALRRFRAMTLSLVLLGLVGGAAAGYLLLGEPSAQGALVVRNPATNQILRQGVNSDAAYQTFVAQRAVIVTSTPVLAAASKATGVPMATLQDAVTATVASTGGQVLVTATGTTGQQAATIVDAVVTAYREQTRSDLRALGQAQLEKYTATKRDLDAETAPGNKLTSAQQLAASTALAQVRTQLSSLGAELVPDPTLSVDAARARPAHLLTQVGKNAGIGGAVGLLLATVIAFALADQAAGASPYRRHSRSPASAPAATQHR
jgi:polysaccharide biosynthesis transport protein